MGELMTELEQAARAYHEASEGDNATLQSDTFEDLIEVVHLVGCNMPTQKPKQTIHELAYALARRIKRLSVGKRVDTLNDVRRILHEASPFQGEPVDCVVWVPLDEVIANDYNPNAVAPPEMLLLEHSVQEDGYTQPIVAWEKEDCFEVVDGFHRNRVGRECENIRERIHGYLPLAVINPGREDRGDRIAATIRHNRARGKHQVSAMSEIVIELKRRNWSDKKIGKELGMDPDEVLRLAQISGLAEAFADRDFSKAWEADNWNDGESDETIIDPDDAR